MKVQWFRKIDKIRSFSGGNFTITFIQSQSFSATRKIPVVSFASFCPSSRWSYTLLDTGVVLVFGSSCIRESVGTTIEDRSVEVRVQRSMFRVLKDYQKTERMFASWKFEFLMFFESEIMWKCLASIWTRFGTVGVVHREIVVGLVAVVVVPRQISGKRKAALSSNQNRPIDLRFSVLGIGGSSRHHLGC